MLPFVRNDIPVFEIGTLWTAKKHLGRGCGGHVYTGLCGQTCRQPPYQSSLSEVPEVLWICHFPIFQVTRRMWQAPFPCSQVLVLLGPSLWPSFLLSSPPPLFFSPPSSSLSSPTSFVFQSPSLFPPLPFLHLPWILRKFSLAFPLKISVSLHPDSSPNPHPKSREEAQ